MTNLDLGPTQENFNPYAGLVSRIAHLPDDTPQKHIHRMIEAGLAGEPLGLTFGQRVGVSVAAIAVVGTLLAPRAERSVHSGSFATTAHTTQVLPSQPGDVTLPPYELTNASAPLPTSAPIPADVFKPVADNTHAFSGRTAGFGLDERRLVLSPQVPSADVLTAALPVAPIVGNMDSSSGVEMRQVKLTNIELAATQTPTPGLDLSQAAASPPADVAKLLPKDKKGVAPPVATSQGGASLAEAQPDAFDIGTMTTPLPQNPGLLFPADTPIVPVLELGVFDPKAPKKSSAPPKAAVAPSASPAGAAPTIVEKPNYAALPSFKGVDPAIIQHAAQYLDDTPGVDLSPRGALALTASGLTESGLNPGAIGDHGTARLVFQQRFGRLQRMQDCIAGRPRTGSPWDALDDNLYCAVTVDMRTDAQSVKGHVLETLRDPHATQAQLNGVIHTFERYSTRDRHPRDGRPDGQGTRFEDAARMIELVEGAPPLQIVVQAPAPAPTPPAAAAPAPALTPIDPNQVAQFFAPSQPTAAEASPHPDGAASTSTTQPPLVPITIPGAVLDLTKPLIDPASVLPAEGAAPPPADVAAPNNTEEDDAPTEEELQAAQPDDTKPQQTPAPVPQTPLPESHRTFVHQGPYVQMPESDDGTWRFESFTPPSDRFGNQDMVEIMMAVDKTFVNKHPEIEDLHVNQGDLNAKKGHDSHRTGDDEDFDISGIGSDGRQVWGADMTKKGYDAALTVDYNKYLIDISGCRVRRLFFNDPVVIRAVNDFAQQRCGTRPMQPWKNHENHEHVRYADSTP